MQKNAFRFFRVAASLLFVACLLAFGLAAAPAQDDEYGDTGVRSYTVKHSQVVPTVLPGPSGKAEISGKEGPRTGSPMRGLWLLPKMTKKLFRGVHNVVLGWVEVPKNIIVEGVKTDPFTGAIVGTVLGAVKTVERTGVGAIEILTFWHEWPKEYGPIVEPEYVLDDFND
jgi:putative exosortase-associated protein (TIGR04073 family)